MIAGLLLAAGRSRRFGGDKLAALLGGRPLVRWSAEALAAAVQPALVVLAPAGAGVREALAGVELVFVEHPDRDRGLGSSIAAGVRALPSGVDALVLALADQPMIGTDVIGRLVAEWRRTGAPAVVPRYADGRGHPVLFDRQCFAALERLAEEREDRGARTVLDSLGAAVRLVHLPGERPVDVDTPDALRALEARLGTRVTSGG